MTVALDVGDCTNLCITSSSEVSTTSQLMFGVANNYFNQAKDILNIHYSRGSFPPYPYRVTNMSCKYYSVVIIFIIFVTYLFV